MIQTFSALTNRLNWPWKHPWPPYVQRLHCSPTASCYSLSCPKPSRFQSHCTAWDSCLEYGPPVLTWPPSFSSFGSFSDHLSKVARSSLISGQFPTYHQNLIYFTPLISNYLVSLLDNARTACPWGQALGLCHCYGHNISHAVNDKINRIISTII